ncbi:MAG: hypothetical protein ACLRVZ_04860 [Turicibacter sp.]
MSLFKFSYNPLAIIYKNSRKEFPHLVSKNYTLYQFRNVLTAYYKEKKLQELEEIKFYLNHDFQQLELHNFDNFFSIRLGYYAIVLSVFAIILSSSDLTIAYNINPKIFIYISILLLGFFILIYNLMSNYQKDRLVYLRFKKECLETAINSKKKPSRFSS